MLFLHLQGRLGPGRLHHCMRLIGAAERGMQMTVERALKRRAFGKLIAEHGSFLSDIAKVKLAPLFFFLLPGHLLKMYHLSDSNIKSPSFTFACDSFFIKNDV